MSSKSYFDSIAQDWDQMRSGFFPNSVRDRAIAQIEIKKGITVADVGSGSGFITEALLPFPVNIIAIDQSKEMLHQMESKFGDQQIRYINSDSENINLEDNSVHHALANMYLHHVERPEESIAELYRILVPGGKLVITDLDKHNYEWLAIEQYDRWLGFDRTDIERWFEKAGFKNIIIDCVDANCCSDSCTTDEKADISIFIAVAQK